VRLTARFNRLVVLFLLSWTVDAAAAGSFILTKSADTTTVTAVGQTINYTFHLTNNTATFFDAVVNDSQAPPAGQIGTGQICIIPMHPSTQAICTASYTVTAADLANCQIQDTATATGEFTIGSTTTIYATSNPSTVTVGVVTAPTITSAGGTTFFVGIAGSFTLTTTSCSPVTIAETGGLPAGVTWTDNGDGTATLSGKPGPGTAGQYPITIGANNGMGSTQTFTLRVAEPAVGAPALQRWMLLLLGALVATVAFVQWRRAR
jgi:hypothetical protein